MSMITVFTQVDTERLTQSFTTGEMQHLVNAIYKYHGIAAQKLGRPKGRHVKMDGKEYILVPVEDE